MVTARKSRGEDLFLPLRPEEVTLPQLWELLGACDLCGSLRHRKRGCVEDHRRWAAEQPGEVGWQPQPPQAASSAAARAAAQAEAAAPAAAAIAPFVPQQAGTSADGPCAMEE